ncbi:MAG TPA: BON domain-containing protein [Pyrinomonadaceae bacterium]|nr:BON domain-containing protein [Pyrinomonadaceae bacterium]
MSKSKLAALVAGTALAAVTAGCGDAANTNTTVANANRVVANSNVAVVVNNNSNPAVATSGITSTRNYNTRADYERDDKTYRDEVRTGARTSGDTIGQNVEDGWLHFKTRAQLATIDDLRDSTINVDVENAVVTLKGSVGSQAQVTAADKAAKSIEGVKTVRNQLKVGAVGTGTTNSNMANTNRR